MMSEQITYPDYVWWVKPGKLAGMSRPLLEDLPTLYETKSASSGSLYEWQPQNGNSFSCLSDR
jgi:hypothetical protein